MAMLRLAADRRVPRLVSGENCATWPTFGADHARKAAPSLHRGNGPIVILVHGFMFDPFNSRLRADPQRFLYHFDRDFALADPLRRSTSWPLGLGFSGEADQGGEGLCVGFGWRARVALPQAWVQHNRRRFSLAYDEAAEAGIALAEAVRRLADAFPDRRIDLVAHSLGARVALAAIRDLSGPARAKGPTLGRVLLLNPAEFTETARATLRAAGGAAPEIYAFGARENDIFNTMLETLAPRVDCPRIGLGRAGLGQHHPRWLDLQLDRPETGDWLNAQGFAFDDSPRRVCHWGVYNREGALALYGHILRERHALSLMALREAGIPEGFIPRTPRLPRLRRPVAAGGESIASSGAAAI